MCYNNELLRTDRIIIDTSVVMNESFGDFVDKVKLDFLQANKKMIIPREVCLEIAKHLGSENHEKNEAALRGITVMTNNQQIFDIENKNLIENEIAKAFADADIIANLAKNRIHFSQMLITCDRKLSLDANKLNSLESCIGREVIVRHIGKYGDLMVCDNLSVEKTSLENETEEKIEIPSIPDFLLKDDDDNNYKKKWQFDWKSALIGTSSLGFGIIFCKLGLPAIVKATKSFR